MIEPIERQEPIDNSDPHDAIEPTDRIEPMDPTDNTEPLQPIDSTEFSDLSDHLEPSPALRTQGMLDATPSALPQPRGQCPRQQIEHRQQQRGSKSQAGDHVAVPDS